MQSKRNTSSSLLGSFITPPPAPPPLPSPPPGGLAPCDPHAIRALCPSCTLCSCAIAPWAYPATPPHIPRSTGGSPCCPPPGGNYQWWGGGQPLLHTTRWHSTTRHAAPAPALLCRHRGSALLALVGAGNGSRNPTTIWVHAAFTTMRWKRGVVGVGVVQWAGARLCFSTLCCCCCAPPRACWAPVNLPPPPPQG